MGILDFLKTKKISDFSREELEKVAADNNIDFTAETSDEDLQLLISKKAKQEKAPLKGTKKIKFLKSPTGRFKLGYSIGDVAKFEANKAQELIDASYAVEVK